MVQAEIKPGGISINDFAADKQVKLFTTLKQNQFSGQFKLKSPKGPAWIFYLHWGRLVYATGGHHAIRRWFRQVSLYCPSVPLEKSLLAFDISQCPKNDAHLSWEYRILNLWYQQGKITQKQAAQVISAIIIEVLFDITQTGKVLYEIHPEGSPTEQLVLISAEQAIRKTEKLWNQWKGAKLANYSPNLVPSIKSLDELKQRTPEKVYQTLTKTVDGQCTFRDLSTRFKRNVMDVTLSLLPYIQVGALELTNVPDFQLPCKPKAPPKPTPSKDAPLIACIDDSPAVCQAMEKLLSKTGYRTVTIQDPLRALAVLLARKPDLIFLDLVMPNANGYEICGHLRRLPLFKETPIVILTGNDGVVDRMRAKMVGASAFLTKPVKAKVLLAIVRKQLSQKPTAPV